MNNCNQRVVRHGLQVIRSSDSQVPGEDSGIGGRLAAPIDQSSLTSQKQSNQGSLLIDATCALLDTRHLIDLSLLNDAREVTKILIDAMHPQIRGRFGHKPCTHRKKAGSSFLL